MIFVSLDPFAVKRFFLFLLAAIAFSCISCFGQSIFLTVKNTPYDKQMTRIRPILIGEGRPAKNEVSLRIVNYWMGDLRAIPYGFTKKWKTPAETLSGAPADCKAKAVALYERMQAHGATNMRLVIGKRATTSRSTHAWVEWETGSGTYILDPTFNWRAFQGKEIGGRSYVPYYAYEGTRKLRASSTTMVAQN